MQTRPPPAGAFSGTKQVERPFQRANSVLSNLSYEQILYYLNQLLGKGLIAQDVSDGAFVYRTTEKGREFLACYSRMTDLKTESYENEKVPILIV